MAENKEGGILFGIRLDNSELQKDVEVANRLLDSITQRAAAEQQRTQAIIGSIQQQAMGVKMNIDTSPVSASVSQATNSIKTISPVVSEEMSQIQEMFTELGGRVQSVGSLIKTAVAGYFTIEGIKGFAQQVFNVRSQFASLEVSFDTLLGNHAKAQKLFNDIKQYGATTPMNLKGLAGATQTMLGFGIESEKVMGYLRALGDISMGDEGRFQSLALAFSQASASGKLMGQDLMQMINAGFNPLEQMAKTTGKSIAELKDEMSKGAISAEMLQQAFMDAAGEGGKYHGMLEAQSKTLSGAYSNLQDNIDAIYNEIGEMTEDIMVNAINGVGELAQNWKEVASIVLEVAAVYGSFKGASMLETAVEEVLAQRDAEESLVEVFKQHGEEVKNLMDADDAYAMSLSGLEEGSAEYMAGLMGRVEAAAEAAAEELKNCEMLEKAETARLSKQEEAVAAARNEVKAATETGNAQRIAAAQTKLETAEEARNTTAKALNTITTQKQVAAEKAATASKKAATFATLRNTTATQSASVASLTWAKAQAVLSKACTKVSNAIESTIASNPYALAIAGAIALAEAIYEIVKAEDARQKATATQTKAQADAFKAATDEEIKLGVGMDFDNIKKLEEGSKAYNDAVQAMVDKYPALKSALGDEFTKAELLEKGYKAVSDAIYEKALAQSYASQIEENAGSVSEQMGEVLKEFNKLMEDQDIDKKTADTLSKKFSKALRDGIKPEDMDEDIRAIFEQSQHSFADAASDLLSSNVLTASASWLYESYKKYTQSNAESLGTFVKQVGSMSDELEYGNTAIEGSIAKLYKQQAAYKEVNDTMQETIDKQKELTEAEQEAAKETSVLDALKEKQKALKTEMEKFTPSQLADNKLLAEKRNAYNKLNKEIADYNKKVFGAGNKGSEDKFKKEISRYKAFADEWVRIEQDRQKKLDDIEKRRKAPGANNAILDMEAEDINKRFADSEAMLKAKFSDIDPATFDNVKKSFSAALTMPIDEAKAQLLEVTKQLSQISEGKKTVSKEKQATLEAQSAGLQFAVNKSYEKEDFSKKEQSYEQFYDAVEKLAVERQSRIEAIIRQNAAGAMTDEAANQAIKNIDKVFNLETTVIMQKFDKTEADLSEGVLGMLDNSMNLLLEDLREQADGLGKEVEFLTDKLSNGVDVSGSLNTVREMYNATIAELQAKTDEQISFLLSKGSEYAAEIKSLEARMANGEDVSKELAQAKVAYSNINEQVKAARENTEKLNESSGELTERQQQLLDIMTKEAKWSKAQDYYRAAADGLKGIMDSCDGVSDDTKEMINNMVDLGMSVFDIVGSLQSYTQGVVEAEEAAGVASAEAVSTAEKGSVILTIISAAIKATMAIIKIFNKHGKNAQINKNIESIEGQVQKLDKAYEKLDKRISKAYGNTALGLINEQDRLIRQKQALLKQELAEEMSRKKKKQDENTIRDLRQQIEDLDEALANRDEDIVTTLLGSDYNSIIEDFSDAMVSAMDDADTSIEDAVDNITKNLQKSAVKIKLNELLMGTENAPGAARKYADAYAKAIADGVIDATEQATLDGYQQQIKTTGETFLSGIKGLFNDAIEEVEETEEKGRKGITGGVSNMTQDTAEELNGRMTQIQSHTFSMSENVRQLTEFSNEQLVMLQSINANTAEIVKNQKNMATQLTDIQLRGLKLK